MGQRCEYKDLDGSYLRKTLLLNTLRTSLFFLLTYLFLFGCQIFSTQRKDHAGAGKHRWRGHRGRRPSCYNFHHILYLHPPTKERTATQVFALQFIEIVLALIFIFSFSGFPIIVLSK